MRCRGLSRKQTMRESARHCAAAWDVADFRKLRVWQAAGRHSLLTHIAFRAACEAPIAWRLSDQLTRAAMSVPANIVEGSAHTSPSPQIAIGYPL